MLLVYHKIDTASHFNRPGHTLNIMVLEQHNPDLCKYREGVDFPTFNCLHPSGMNADPYFMSFLSHCLPLIFCICSIVFVILSMSYHLSSLVYPIRAFFVE